MAEGRWQLIHRLNLVITIGDGGVTGYPKSFNKRWRISGFFLFYLLNFSLVLKLWITFFEMACKSCFLFSKFVLTGVSRWFIITLECNKVVQSGDYPSTNSDSV